MKRLMGVPKDQRIWERPSQLLGFSEGLLGLQASQASLKEPHKCSVESSEREEHLLAAPAPEGWGPRHEVKHSGNHTVDLLHIGELERRPQLF